jgi:hypothetical protein
MTKLSKCDRVHPVTAPDDRLPPPSLTALQLAYTRGAVNGDRQLGGTAAGPHPHPCHMPGCRLPALATGAFCSEYHAERYLDLARDADLDDGRHLNRDEETI